MTTPTPPTWTGRLMCEIGDDPEDTGTYLLDYGLDDPVPDWLVDADLIVARVGDFHLIPASQCEQVVKEYELPAELVEDAVLCDQAHSQMLRDAVAHAVADGLLIISPPVRTRLPNATFMANMAWFRLTATGWRPPVEETPTS